MLLTETVYYVQLYSDKKTLSLLYFWNLPSRYGEVLASSVELINYCGSLIKFGQIVQTEPWNNIILINENMNVFFKLIHGLGWMVNWGRCNYNALHLNIFRVNNVSSIQNTMWYKLGVYSILQNKYRPYVYYFLIDFFYLWSGKENKPKHQKCFKSGPSMFQISTKIQALSQFQYLTPISTLRIWYDPCMSENST